MYGKLSDLYMMAYAFVNVSVEKAKAKRGPDSEETVKRLLRGMGDIACHVSLYSALAAHRLTRGDNERMNQRGEIAAWKDMIVLRRELSTDHRNLTGSDNLPTFKEFPPEFLRMQESTLQAAASKFDSCVSNVSR